MKFYYYILIFLISFGLFLSAFFAFNLIPTKTLEFKPINLINKTENVYTNTTQFYPNMRYPDRKINYNISNDCDNNKQKNIVEAFSILGQKTILQFTQIDGDAEIEVTCSEVSPRPEDKDHYIAGEGGPKDIIDAGRYYVIKSGRLTLYREEKCNQPKIAIHEILHALGFDHNNDPESIMYPVTSCDEQIDSYIVNQIDRLYADDSLPDLSIEKASAEKNGRYLNFNIEIKNIGLSNSENAILEIYANNQFIKDFEVGNINIGIKKIIEVQNLKIPSDSEQLEFRVISSDANELTKDNNKATLNIIE